MRSDGSSSKYYLSGVKGRKTDFLFRMYGRLAFFTFKTIPNDLNDANESNNIMQVHANKQNSEYEVDFLLPSLGAYIY